jgi:hypothetical protein
MLHDEIRSRLRGIPQALRAARCHHGFPVLTVSGHHLFYVLVDEKEDIVRLVQHAIRGEVPAHRQKKLSHGRCEIHQMMAVGFPQRKKSAQPCVPPPGTSPFMVPPSEGRTHALKRAFLCLELSAANVPHWRWAFQVCSNHIEGLARDFNKPRRHHI